MTDLLGFENAAALSSWAMSMISTYALRTADGVVNAAADETKKAVMSAASRTWGWLKQQWAEDTAAIAMVEFLEAEAGDARVREQLERKLVLDIECNAAFRDGLIPLLEELHRTSGTMQIAGRDALHMEMNNLGAGAKAAQVSGRDNTTSIG